MHIYVHIYEEVIFQNMNFKSGIAIATSIFRLALNTFWKRVLHIESTSGSPVFVNAEIGLHETVIWLSRDQYFVNCYITSFATE